MFQCTIYKIINRETLKILLIAVFPVCDVPPCGVYCTPVSGAPLQPQTTSPLLSSSPLSVRHKPPANINQQRRSKCEHFTISNAVAIIALKSILELL